MVQYPHGKPSRVVNYIRAWRRHRDMFMETLGERLGKTKNTISRWERQLGSPTIDDLADIAACLDCTVIDLRYRLTIWALANSRVIRYTVIVLATR